MRLSHRAGAILAAAGLSLGLFSGAGAQERRRGPGVNVAVLVNRLDLTEEQKAKIEEARKAQAAEFERIRGLTDRQEQAQARRKATQTFQAAIRDVLTPDQRQRLQALTAEAREYRELGPLGIRLVGLNLTADQKAKVKEIGAKYQPELQKLRQQQQNVADRQAVAQQFRELNQKLTGEVREILTPEQRKQFAATAPVRRRQQ